MAGAVPAGLQDNVGRRLHAMSFQRHQAQGTSERSPAHSSHSFYLSANHIASGNCTPAAPPHLTAYCREQHDRQEGCDTKQGHGMYDTLSPASSYSSFDSSVTVSSGQSTLQVVLLFAGCGEFWGPMKN